MKIHSRFSLLKLALVLVALATLAGCATSPVTGKSQFALSESWERSAGAQYHQQIMQQYSEYPDIELQQYVNEIGQKLAKTSHRPDLPFTFTLLDSPEVNAFAVPGGYVYITRGIMAYMTEEAHLAGVIGHEIGHITARHGAQRAAQQQLAGVAAVGAAILTGSQEAAQLSQMLGGALMSGYGRNQELESDRLGAEYIAQNNYDVDDMVGVIGILKDQELFAAARARAEGRAVQSYHGLFSTHPRNDKRLQEVIKAAERYRNPNASGDDNGRFLRLTDGMTYGDSEAQGIVRDNRFYHKDLDLFIEFPDGWRINNGVSAITAVAPTGDKGIRMHMESLPSGQSLAQFMAQKFNAQEVAPAPRSGFGRAYSGRGVVSANSTQTAPVLVGGIERNGSVFVLLGYGQTGLPNAEFGGVVESLRPLKRGESSLATSRKNQVSTCGARRYLRVSCASRKS